MSLAFRPLLPAVVLGVLAVFQPWLEQSMALHMCVEIPLLFITGWWCQSRTGIATDTLARIDPRGLVSLTAATLVLAFWMLPIALDDAVLHAGVGLAKVGTVVAAGILGRFGFTAASISLQAFFVMNWAWMTAVVGLLYQQMPDRLCNAYLQGDQTRAGMGLVSLAVLVTGLWLARTFVAKDEPDEQVELESRGGEPLS